MSESAGRPLPCPFCGGEQVHEDVVPNTQGNRRFMCCTTCLARGPWSRIDKNAQERWDTRAPSPAGPDALAEEIHPAIKRLMNLAHEFWDDGLEQSNKIILECCEQLEQALHSRPAQGRDAERYRWLREARLDAGRNQISMVTIHGMEHAFEELDAAIDAAMSQQEPQK